MVLDDKNPLNGFSVVGRHGHLGTVVPSTADNPHRLIRFRGGESGALLFHIPLSCVDDISVPARAIKVDVDVGDFAARVGEGGMVELHLVP